MPVDFDQLDLYSVLQVSEHATDNELKAAYRKRALEHHPDKNKDDVEGATRRFGRVSEAYEILSDEIKRAEYDLQRLSRRPQSNSSSSSRSQPQPQPSPRQPSSTDSQTSEDGLFSWIFWVLLFRWIFGGFLYSQLPAPFRKLDPKVYRARNRHRKRSPGLSAKDLAEYLILLGDHSEWKKSWRGNDRFTLLRNMFECIAFDEKQWGCKEDIPGFGTGKTLWCPDDDRGASTFYAKDFYVGYWSKFETRKTFEWIQPYPNGLGISGAYAWHNAHAQAMARSEYNGIINDLIDHLRKGDPRYIWHLHREQMIREMFERAYRRHQHFGHGRPVPEPSGGPKKQTRQQRKKQKQRNKEKQRKAW